MSHRPALDIECISLVHLYHLPDTEVVALRGVDLDIEAGELVCLLGPSGTGKSTLLRIIAGMLRPSAGQVLVGGRDITRLSTGELRRYRASDVGIVLQDPIDNLLPYATVSENIALAAEVAEVTGVTPPLSGQELLELLTLADRANQPVSTLSGGEQQLAALGCGAAAGGRLLLVDEPTSQLDHHERDGVIAALHDLHSSSGATVVIVTHDAELAASVPRTVTVRHGRVGAEGRHGSQFAVVGRDGTVQLPPEALEVLPPDTLVRIIRHAHGIELHAQHSESDLLGEIAKTDEQPS